MGIPGIRFFGDKTKEELQSELVSTEKKLAKLDEKRIQLKVAIAIMEHEDTCDC